MYLRKNSSCIIRKKKYTDTLIVPNNELSSQSFRLKSGDIFVLWRRSFCSFRIRSFHGRRWRPSGRVTPVAKMPHQLLLLPLQLLLTPKHFPKIGRCHCIITERKHRCGFRVTPIGPIIRAALSSSGQV